MPDPILRLAYRAGWWGMRIYWLLVRPKVHGVKCLIVRGDELVLVRHTYGTRDRWELPGGGIKRGEEAMQAARREAYEEIGADLPEWRYLGDLLARVHHKRDTMSCFSAEVDELELTPDGAEIAEAGWFRRADLPKHAARYVARVERMHAKALEADPAQPPPTR